LLVVGTYAQKQSTNGEAPSITPSKACPLNGAKSANERAEFEKKMFYFATKNVPFANSQKMSMKSNH
jgi:hypothetical protein